MYHPNNVTLIRELVFEDACSSQQSQPSINATSSPANILRCDINLEDFTVLWLDTNNNTSEDCLRTIQQLRSVINYLKTFTTVDECVEYVKEYYSETLFLITSGELGEQIVPIVHDLTQIQSIYVFCLKQYLHEQWTANYSKVKGVFVNRNNLIRTLKANVLECTCSPMTIDNSLRYLNDDRASTMWFELLLTTLIRMEYSGAKAKQDLIEQCRLYYADNESQIKVIEEFEREYKPSEAIKWYTRDSFVYRLLNKAFRTENIDIIYMFRFFVKDLYNQLKQLYEEFIKVIREWDLLKLTLYRGQLLTCNELEKVKQNINNYVSMNTFLSTTMDEIVARRYSGEGLQKPLLESVVFVLDIDIDIIQLPIADIQEHSYFKDESEILLPVGIQFQIKSVDKMENIWYINLSTCREPINAWNQLNDYILKQEIGDKPTNEAFLFLLNSMGNTIKSDQYKNLINMENEVQCRLSQSTVDTDTAATLRYYEKIIEEKTETALYCEQLAVRRFETSLMNPFEWRQLFFYIAYASYSIEDNESALTYISFVLKIDLKYLPFGHPYFGYDYMLAGKIHRSLNNYDSALSYYEKALEAALVYLPLNHPSFARIYVTMALVHRQLKNDEKALIYVEKAENLLKQTSHIHEKGDISRLIGIVDSRINGHIPLEDYKKRFENDRKSKQFNELEELDYWDVDFIMNARIYLEQGKPEIAIKKFKKGLDRLIQQYSLDIHHSTFDIIASVYNEIGDAYCSMNDGTSTIELYQCCRCVSSSRTRNDSSI
ncbi:unnamed protein product [Didymodactylos carnosus]|uniref:Uncharacterized protein n=1 Tax=Didymodactylos carnosus TaxID=1234261 RepID=A0A8S2E7C5_9BILA|nr:unnamed protein product [Didymodactylos carnosus]CAF3833924.1 unnamed protein product [Didymodactylos carnosus]